MSKNRATVIVDIVGQAQSLQKTIENAQNSLGKLQLNPKIYQEMQRQTNNMIENLKKATNAGKLGIKSQTGLDNEEKRIKQISIEFSNCLID